ncbi:MAG: TolC family protein [Phocaeicola sp.]
MNRIKKRYYIAGALLCSLPLQAQTFTLQACKERAVAHSYELKNKALEQSISKQTQREAFTHYFPTVEALGGYMHASKDLISLSMQNPLTGGPLEIGFLDKGLVGGVMLVQPIFAGGQIVNGNRLAQLEGEATRYQLELTTEAIERKAEGYFWQGVKLEENLKTIAAMEEWLSQIRHDVEAFVSAGVTTRNDLLRVTLQENELASERLRVENGQQLTRLLLGQLMGVPATDLRLSYSEEQGEESPLTHYVEATQAATNRPEAQLLALQVEASKLQKKIEVGKRLPTVGVGGNYIYHNVLPDKFSGAVAFATVKVPLSDWWGGSHAIKKQALKQQQAYNEQQNGMEMLAVQIEKEWCQLQEAYKQLLLADHSVASAQEHLRMSRNYYKAGTATLTELLEAQQLLQSCESKRIAAKVEYAYQLAIYKQYGI